MRSPGRRLGAGRASSSTESVEHELRYHASDARVLVADGRDLRPDRHILDRYVRCDPETLPGEIQHAVTASQAKALPVARKRSGFGFAVGMGLELGPLPLHGLVTSEVHGVSVEPGGRAI